MFWMQVVQKRNVDSYLQSDSTADTSVGVIYRWPKVSLECRSQIVSAAQCTAMTFNGFYPGLYRADSDGFAGSGTHDMSAGLSQGGAPVTHVIAASCYNNADDLPRSRLKIMTSTMPVVTNDMWVGCSNRCTTWKQEELHLREERCTDIGTGGQ